MGDRASYAVREHGNIEVFCAQFGANTLLADVFWGPTEAEAAIRAQQPTSGWLDDVYGEAAVALCKDTRTVAFYDCRYSKGASELAADLMTRTWPGWTARAVSLVSGVAAALGVDLTPGVPPSSDRSLRPLDPEFDDGQDVGPPAAIWLAVAGEPVRLCQRHVVELLWCGPALLEARSMFPTLDAVRAVARTRATRGGQPTTLLTADGRSPASVVRIDPERRTLSVTVLPGIPALEALAAGRRSTEAWPGWSVTWTVGPPSVPFGVLGEPVPADLLPRPPAAPMGEVLRELAGRLLGGEALKRFAVGWLAGVSAEVGVPLTPPPASELSDEERIARFSRAVAALGLPPSEVSGLDAVAAAATEPRAVTELSLGGRPGWLVAYSQVEHGGRTFAAYQPPDGGGTLVLLAWDDPSAPPDEVCVLRDPPMKGWYVGLEVAPSGRWLAARIQSGGRHELVAVDLEARRARPLGVSGPDAGFDTTSHLALDEDRLALDVLGADGRCVVVVVDRERGPIGEIRGRCLGRFAGGRLETSVAVIDGDAYHLVAGDSEDLLDGTGASARLRLSGDEVPFADRVHALVAAEQWSALADLCEARGDDPIALRHLSTARQRLGDPVRALAAAERCAAVAPFHARGQLQRAILFAAAGDLDRAAAAAVRAAEGRPFDQELVYADPGLAPLHGHPAFRALDYLRLLREGQPLSAIPLAPERPEAYRALISAGAATPELLDSWVAHAPESYEAHLARATDRVGRGTPEAWTSAAAVADRWPTAWEPKVLLARVRAAEGDRDAARTLLDAAGACHPGGIEELADELGDDDGLSALLPDAP